MADYTKEVLKLLHENGCQFVRHGKGDHDIWYSPLTKTNFPVDGKVIIRHVANAIMRQSGIDHKF